ncbi:MAG: helical backbone metal receptor [Planctomycetota bacterium]
MARLVSLCPSLTETLFDLGAGPEVVGATKFCVHPVAGVEHVVRVGGTKDPRLDRILDLRPTLVLANEEENRLEDVEALREAGVAVHTSLPRRVADVPPLIRELGGVVGHADRAEDLALGVEEAATRAQEAAAMRSPRRVLVLIWRRPWMSANGDTFLSDLLATAGGRNVVADRAERYPRLELDEVRALDPDLVLLPSEPFPFKEEHVDELVTRTRIGRSRFLGCDGELLTWHGSRTAAGLSAATRWLA